METAAATGHAGGWFLWSLVSAGEFLVVWIATVATWRSAQRGPIGGAHYGLVAIGLAFVFVGVQLVVTIGWTGWTALAGLGLAPSPALVILDRVIRYSYWVLG